MPVRRSADPISVQHIWDAIRSANTQRQMADGPRISRYLQKITNCSPAQAELYIKQTIDDGLIVALQKYSAKSTNVGEQVESYRIPQQEVITIDDGKDWYCIECHLAGDVIPCKTCHRVFHEECASNSHEKQRHTQSSPRSVVSYYNGENNESIQLKECRVVLNNNINANSYSTNETKSSNGNDISNGSKLECTNNRTANKYDKDLCSICNLINNDVDVIFDREELNHLLYFILERIRSWIPENITNTLSQDNKLEWHTESELSWRAKQLFYEHLDMPIIGLKVKTRDYSRLCEFQADVLSVQHNIAIFHGIESQEYGAAELMLKDCLYDINELKNCVDCYKHSNEKINNRWFCLPCRKPHKLVWAKQKGYPYWPAKVIKETDSNCDVRFFGGKYERSVLPKNCIKPIAVSLHSLQIKRSSAFNRAYDELLLHQKILDNPDELQKFISNKKNRKSSSSSSSTTTKRDSRNSFKVKSAKTKSPLNRPRDIYDFQDSPQDNEMNFPFNQASKRRRSSSPTNKNGLKGTQKTPRSVLNSTENESFGDVIDISDADECEDFNKDDDFMSSLDGSHELVSSSTEYVRTKENTFRENSDSSMHQLDQPYNDSVEKMRRKLEQCKNKQQLIKTAMDCMQAEIDKITNDHSEQLRKLFDAHNAQISETKKKQWCYNCEQDAIYHCCWNTAYCSQTCQQQHWQAEHKKVCRRKR